MKKALRTTLASLVLIPSLSWASADLSTLLPQEVHRSTLKDIVNSLQSAHYNKIQINDELSSRLLDSYIKSLDPNRLAFYQSDIVEFDTYRYTLDDEVEAGNLEHAYQIFNRAQQRIKQQLDWFIARLNDETPFDFNKDETLDTDRSDNEWAMNKKELEDLWRKYLKSALLNLRLADKTGEDAREVLIKRYQNQLKRISQTNSEDVFQQFVNVFTKKFDPHTSYFSPRNSENFKINMSLSLEGIGAVLQSENEHTKIVRLVPAGPADKTGQLKPSDLIVGVGQGTEGAIEDVVGLRLDDVVDKIRGPKGSIVRLEVIPSGSADQTARKVVLIERNKVRLEEQAAHKEIIDIEHKGRNYKLGVIDIPAFYIDFAALQRGDADYKSTTRDVEQLVKELKSDKIDGLIIDLRNNGGGSLREANELVGLFIDRGPTVQIRDPQGRVDILGDFNPKIAYTGQMAVLVNRLSASASEIFAGAIQDYRRGLVIGDQTFGKGTVQTLQPLNHGQLKLTHAKFYRISGESTQNKGVIPDVTMPSLFDKEEIGESALEGALPWDEVKQAKHGMYSGFSPFLSKLLARHKARVSTQPDFIFMREQIARQREDKTNDLVPLNESALKLKREEAENWQLEAENRRRVAKGETPIKQLSELDDLLKKDEQGTPISEESRAVLTESGRILIDLMELSTHYAANN